MSGPWLSRVRSNLCPGRKPVLWTVSALCWLNALAVSAAAAENSEASTSDSLIAVHDGFVDEKTCAACHADQAAAFAKSHHAKAMAVADDRSVLGNFNNIQFDRDGVAASFFRRNDRFFVRTEGPDGKQADYEVKYTFAYEPLQQYLVDLGGGRLQALDIAWDSQKQEWFWLGEGSAPRPGSTFHWTGPFYRWNRTCIDCHSTDPQTNFQPQENEYKSSYVATSIGCQSCHGGGAKHVEWARAKAANASAAATDSGLAKVDANTCFACHARRIRLVDGYRPGGAFLDQFSPALLRSGLYFPDGQILDEVFEYGSFQQSKMAKAGVTCFDCHRPHEGTVKAEGNALCTQCHAETAPERFAGNDPSGAFDTPAHTHHPQGSSGALCANCHMPERTYMKVDSRRDHSFVVPRPDLSALYGTPNACTSCHAGQTNARASEHLDRWYGKAWRERPTIAHAFSRAAQNDVAAIEKLRRLLTDREQPGIVRGSAIAEMTRLGGAATAAEVNTAAADPDPLVRLGAAEAAENLPSELRLAAIGGLLGDKTRAVRVAAVRALGTTQSLDFLGDQRRAFDAAVDDLRAYVEANADVAEAQSTYGSFLFGQGRTDEAEKAFRQAVTLDPTFSGARINLAELYRASGNNEKSEQAYAEAVAANPDLADLRYGHGLSLVRQKAMPEAIEELEAAVRLEPANTRYRMTAAIALDAVGRTEDAFGLFDPVDAGGATDADLLGTAIQIGLKLGRYAETLEFAEALARLRPNDAPTAELVRQLQDAVQHGR
ncbi:tetratricopeptide repeat protein [Sinorhizobium meliloti]|uniref:tetratricopeptide repeat protein n=1 Tax=Rhizobium meliloti TaxID=382 RepID=UPI0013E2BCF2|nr:tetratricopeptide repeat protein [Sinorhizobium meliloti]